MIRSFTTVEQSKKLVEAGVDPRTADMNYTGVDDDSLFASLVPYKKFNPNLGRPIYPCWSIARLMALLPYEIVADKDKRGRKIYVFSLEKFEPWQYSFAYYRLTQDGEIDTIWDEICLDSPLDILVDALCWVMTNEYEDKETQLEIAEKE